MTEQKTLPYQILFEASPLPGVLARKSDGLMRAFNDAWVALLGYSREQMLGRKTTDFDVWVEPGGRARFLAELPTTESHHLLRLKDGRVHRARLHGREIDIDGEVCLLVFVSEVRREYEAEQALEAANRALERRVELLEASEKLARMGHWTNADTDATVKWSAGLFDITGYTPKDILTRSEGRSGIHPDDIEAWVAARNASDNREMEFRWVRPDGALRWFRTRMGRTLVAEDESPSFGVIQDITAEREATQHLQAQLALVQNITVHVPAVLLQAWSGPDGTPKVSFVNEAVRDLLEIGPEDVMREPSVCLDRIHPVDRGKLLAALRMCARDLVPLQMDLRLDLPEKGERWCNVMAVPVSQAAGAVLWHGFISDATDSVQTTEALRDTLESINQGLLKVDAGGRVLFYNQQALRMLDLPESLMAGRPTAREVLQFQMDRGDFGDDLELVEPDARAHLKALAASFPKSAALNWNDRYLRRTRAGRTLEIRTRQMPNGTVVRTYDDVTTFIQAQDALMAERQQLQATSALLAERTQALQDTLESISQGLTKTDVNGRFVLYNQRLLEMLDLPESMMAGKPDAMDVMRFQMARGDFGPDLNCIENKARQGFVKQSPPEIPDHYLRQTQDGRTLEFRSRLLDDGSLVRTCTDVTSYIEAQKALTAERQRLEWVLEATRPGIWETDLVTGAMTINARWAEMLGYTVEELAPISERTWTDLVHPDDLGIALERQRAHCDNETPYFECDLRMRHKNGHWIWVNDRGQVHRRGSDGQAIYMSGTHIDITDRVLAQEEVRALNASLERRVASRTEELERTLRDMEAVSYSIAHDLRAPLRAVNGFAAVIAESGKVGQDPQVQDMFERIVRSSRTMGQMLTEMLGLLQVVRTDVAPVHVDMNATARSVIDALGGADPRVRVEVQELPPALGDPVLLRQALLNLLDNAMKYSSERDAPLVCIGHDTERRLYFIRDNGIGFDMAHAGKLFGLFQRLHAGSKVPGMGVGLAIVSRIIERHGGRIWAESAPGEGTTFWWTLPPSR